jgi:hypothetical protein
MLCHLRLEDLLHHALYNLLEEVGIGQQDLLRQLRVHPTMIMGHRRSLSIDCLQTPTILEDNGLLGEPSNYRRLWTQLMGQQIV